MKAIEQKHRLKIYVYQGKSRKGFCEIGSVLKKSLEKDKHITFSQCVDSSNGVLGIGAGQAQDLILEQHPYLMKSELFKTVYTLWKKWHLNDMHAGTAVQEEALEKAKKDGILTGNNYDVVVAYLKSIGLYEVVYSGKPYKYGHAWLYRPISQKDLKIMNSLMVKESNTISYIFDDSGNLTIKEK